MCKRNNIHFRKIKEKKVKITYLGVKVSSSAASFNLHPCFPIQRASWKASFITLKVIMVQHDVLLCTRFSTISHTNCGAQYYGRKPKTSVQFTVHLTAESHFVILTVIAVQYVSVVVQEDNITAMRQIVKHTLT